MRLGGFIGQPVIVRDQIAEQFAAGLVHDFFIMAVFFDQAGEFGYEVAEAMEAGRKLLIRFLNEGDTTWWLAGDKTDEARVKLNLPFS